MKGFFEKQWDLFLDDMQEVGAFFLDAFGANEQLKLGSPKEEKVMEGCEPKEERSRESDPFYQLATVAAS